MKTIKFKITTPERTVYEAEVEQVTIPTKKGEITILPDHIPLVSALLPGELKIKRNGEEDLLAVSGGFIEVANNEVTILADSAERADEIDEHRAEEARARAVQMQNEKRFDAEEFATLAAKIEKELARLRVVRKRKPRSLPPNQPLSLQ